MTEKHLENIVAEEITTDRISTRLLRTQATDGEAVIFVHGNVSTATFWEETMLRLPEGFIGYAYDQRGYGAAEESAKIDATRGMGDLSDDLKALLDYLGLENAHLVGHSAGGSVLWRFMMDYPSACKTVTLVNPGSPYGFGGTHGVEGKPNHADFAGSGGGTVNADFPSSLANQDLSEDQGSPRWTMNNFYFKPPFRPEREEAFVLSMCATHVGDQDYPGDLTASENWPNVAPGEYGMINALSPKYLKAINNLYSIESKPPVLWIRGSDDQIVSDASFFDLANLGKLGLVPGWSGDDVAPPQPMVQQIRNVLETYSENDGNYQEVVIDDAGHSPYIEKPEVFDSVFHGFLNNNS